MSAIKDKDNEHPIPLVWREIFCDIVKSFASKNYLTNSTIPNVNSLSTSDALHIQDYIESYGEKLIELPQETWDSSTYLWMGNHWDVIIDLWTLGEGQTDLVLSAKVSEVNNQYVFNIGMIYVP